MIKDVMHQKCTVLLQGYIDARWTNEILVRLYQLIVMPVTSCKIPPFPFRFIIERINSLNNPKGKTLI
jgi:hypothetical protein